MSVNIRQLFLEYLNQLQIIVDKVPEVHFRDTLADDMFCLGVNAKIAANFLLRGYCPVIGRELPDIMQESPVKRAVMQQIQETRDILEALPIINTLDQSIVMNEKAGEAIIELGQVDFIHRYIIPNFMFHMSMVYAVARRKGVALSKGDFDGLHSYPEGFSFV